MATITLKFSNWRGKEQSREVNQTIDLRAYLGTASYPPLVIYANPHLSVADIGMFLDFQARATPGCARSATWIQRHRWMTRRPGDSTGARPSPDGKDTRAVAIMRENPNLSARKLSALLAELGITRNKDWVLET